MDSPAAPDYDVFISYSRRDEVFVRRLFDALSAAEHRAWVDWKGIPPTADFLREIFAAIEGADTFVFVASDNSLGSRHCLEEIRHAVECRKRLVPLVLGEVETELVPEALRRLQWISFRQVEDFERAFAELSQALTTDLDWVRDHTRLLVRGIEWRDAAHEASLLLRGSDLREAEQWLAKGADHEPRPTTLHQEYISASRTSETRRERRVLASVATALVIAIGLALLAWQQRRAAVEQRDEARRQTAVADAQRFEAKRQTAAALGNEVDASLAAGRELEALLGAVRLGRLLQQSSGLNTILPLALRARVALRRGVFETRERQRIVTSHFRGVTHLAFVPDDQSLFSAGGGGGIRHWSLAGRPLAQWDTEHFGEGDGCTSIQNMVLSPDGQTLATVGNEGDFALWTTAGEQRLRFSTNPVGGGYCTGILSSSVDFQAATVTIRDEQQLTTWRFDGTELQRIPGAAEERDWWEEPRQLARDDGAWIARRDDTRTLSIERSSGEETHSLGPQRNPTFSHRSDRIATVADGIDDSVIHLWDLSAPAAGPPADRAQPDEPTPRRAVQLRDTTVPLDAVVTRKGFAGVTSPDGRLAVVVVNELTGRLALWRLARDGAEGAKPAPLVAEFETDQHAGADFPQALESLAFSPDGQRFATGGSDGSVKIWSADDGRLVHRFEAHSQYARARYSPDGRWILTVGDGRDGEAMLRLWSAEGEPLDALTTQRVSGAWFSPDSRWVLATLSTEAEPLMAWSLDIDYITGIGCSLLSLYLSSAAASDEDRLLCVP